MKKPWRDINISLGIFGLVFILQVLLFFLDPAFYLSSVRQSEIPGFIKWSFARYFLLVFGLYGLAALGVGFFNYLVWRWIGAPSRGPRRERISRIALQGAQALGAALLLAYFYPSILDWMPFLDRITLSRSYALMGIAFLGMLGVSLTAQGPLRFRALAGIGFAILLPAGLTYLLILPGELDLPVASASAPAAPPSIYLIGFDSLDGDASMKALQKSGETSGGRLYANAFTTLPSTHPAWNSILTGLYPMNHRVRFFFESPEEGLARAHFLPYLLKERASYQTLFASDQPETSYFLGDHGFDHLLVDTIGWESHLRSIILNHFVFPALWLNNPWVEALSGETLNSPSLFNYNMARFFNFTFKKMSRLPNGPRFLALHNCFLHSPIRLTGAEIRQIPNYLELTPEDFSYWAWPAPGDPPLSTPSGWINPYYVRRSELLEFIPLLLKDMKTKGYLENGTAVFLSDHGERFAKGHEIYGGIHGLDIKTREQNNVLLAIFDGRMKDFRIIQSPVSIIDIAPTALAVSGISPTLLGMDGMALLDGNLHDLPIPERPLWVESMGFVQIPRNNASFPQIAVQTLEENLSYAPNGRVKIGREYYERILRNKEIADLAKEIPAAAAATAQVDSPF